MKPARITFHCSASPNGHPFTAADITAWHTERGFNTIGYHAVICVDGVFQQGRPDDIEGAHVKGHNVNNLGCVMIGTDRFSLSQFEALKWWAKNKMAEYKIPSDQLYCHYEFDTAKMQGKTCPNVPISRLKAWILNDVKEAIEPYLL